MSTGPNVEPKRQQLFRWIGWFFFVNTLMAFCVIFYYHNVVPHFEAVPGAGFWHMVLGWTFFILAFLTQSALFMYFFAAVCSVIALVFPWRWVVFSCAIFFATIVLLFIAGDAIAYTLYHQHYANVAWDIYKANAFNDVLVLGVPEKLTIVGLILVFFIIEYLVAWMIWRCVSRFRSKCFAYIAASSLIFAFLFTYGVTMCLSGTSRHVVLKAARVTPYFSDIYNWIIPGDRSRQVVHTKHGPITLQVNGMQRVLHYPLKPLQCRLSKKPLNIVLVGIDTWRYSAFNSKVTPNIYRFAKSTMQFAYHYSGGNSTRPGIFTLFYSLPENYWRAFLAQHQRPVFINQLMQSGYQMGIFTSAPLTFPAFNQSVFEGIKGLVIKLEGKSSIERDKKVTREFVRFLLKRNPNKPFFSFLFYDAVHNYCEPQTPEKTPFKPYIKSCNRLTLTANTPSLPYLNRYRNAAYFDDGEVKKVLAVLKQQGLLKNTIVIITSDHGEQINDEHRNIWVHASAYTDYQLQVPFIVYWPGKAPRKINYFTSHYDMVPTLMKTVLGCQTPFADYAFGRSLFAAGKRPFIIAGSYGDYAVVEPGKHATRIYPNGDWQVDDIKSEPIPKAELNVQHMRQVYQMLNQFFRVS